METFILPWPVSINRLYTHIGKVRILTTQGRQYRRTIQTLLIDCVPYIGNVSLDITCHPPSNRRYDSSNLSKCFYDSLVLAGLLKDDSYIVEERWTKNKIVPGGVLIMDIASV